jgi:hypothetical protein
MRVFENRVLRKILGPKRDEVTGECKKLHNEEINDQYSSTNMRVIKSRSMRRAEYIAHLEREVHTGFWLENLRERTTCNTQE